MDRPPLVRQHVRRFLAVLLVCLAAHPARSASVTWNGGTDSDWFTPANWSPATVPVNGDDVTIGTGKSVVLSNDTAQLGSLALAGTLTFTNWTTLLSATNIDVQSGGIVQHVVCDTNPVVSNTNRVYISCSNLLVQTGGKIDTYGLGFRGGVNVGTMQSWGQGPGKGYGSWGAGHGGKGAVGRYGGNGGATYGSATAPDQPGSGGGYHNGQTGGHGGGAVWIDATGDVLVNGTISANGHYVRNQGGDGAGGSVYISCRTCIGTNGVISADGGEGNYSSDTGGGGGGGGRVAVLVDATAQSNRVAAAGSSLIFSGNHTFGYYSRARPGSVRLSDRSLWTRSSIRGGAFTIVGLDAWTVTNLSVSGGLAAFSGVDLTVVSNLNTSGRGGLETADGVLRINGDASISGDTYASSRFYAGPGSPLVVEGDLTVTTGDLFMHGNSTNPTTFHVGGDVTVTGGGELFVYAGMTNDTYTNYGALVSVTGDIVVAASSKIYPYSHNTNGGSVHMHAVNVTVAASGQINADGKGFGSQYGSGDGWGYGPGRSWNGAGASYGGSGGDGRYGFFVIGSTYGASNYPVHPGSGGGRHNGATGGNQGGGLARIVAANLVTVDGAISVNGVKGSSQGGSGSGGGVFIDCYGLEGAVAGAITANGGASANDLGGGGGGRIAVRYFSHNTFGGAVSATGGTGSSDPARDGSPGTIDYEQTGNFSALTIDGAPVQYGTPAPQGYETVAYPGGTWITNRIEQIVDGPAGIKRYCTGWDAVTGTVEVAGGSTTQAVFELPAEDTTLTWNWTNLYLLTVTASDHGQASSNKNGYYTNALQVTVTATADVGYVFSQWSGDVPVSDLTNMPLVLTMDQPRTVQANFASESGELKVWTGTGKWTTPGNWTPNGMPGQRDSAIINGSTLLDQAVILRNLTVSNNATITCSNWTTKIKAHDVRILNLGTVTHAVCNTNAVPSNSNRVWFACSNLVVEAGGKIDTADKGFTGGVNVGVMQSWGQGPGGGKGSWGAGYGGRGGIGAYGGDGGPSYGSETQPLMPGSGGGYHNGQVGGNGGGAIWLDVDRAVVVNGTVSADGQGRRNQGGDGSGGSVYLTCRTIAGTNGVISADGGDGNYSGYAGSGGGGGGRIAVVVDAAAQSNLNQTASPDVLFSANNVHAPNGPSRPGTVYLSDPGLWTRTVIQGGSFNVVGKDVWTVTNLAISVGLATFPGWDLTVVSDLTTSGRGGLETSDGSLHITGNMHLDTDAYGVSRLYAQPGAATVVDGNVRVRQGDLYWHSDSTNASTLQVGGSLIVTNGGEAWIYAGMTNVASPEYGALVKVSGDIDIAPSSKLYPCSHTVNGGSPHFTLDNLKVAASGLFSGDGKGFGMEYGSGDGWGYGPGRSYNGAGAGYGGVGGRGQYGSWTIGATYGSSNAPVQPGSGGGRHNGGYSGGQGGGLVWVQARRKVNIDGTISVNGASGASQGGSGSGGGVYLRCRSIEGGGAIRANGGASGTQNGGGGGGRIAVIYDSEDTFTGAAAAVAGSGDLSHLGTDGTVFWYKNPPSGSVVVIR